MIGSLVVFAVTYALIASERLDKTIAAMLGAVAVVLLGFIPYPDALARVDLNVIFLLLGMMIIMNVMADTGVFEWLAVTVAQKARGNGLLLTVLLLATTAVVSAFLDNVTTVILIAPVTLLMAQILELPVVPLLILEAVFSNIGGTATLIGDPPNILIGTRAGLTFNEFIAHLAPCVLAIMAVSLPLIALVLRRGVRTTAAARLRVAQAVPSAAIIDPAKLRRAGPILVAVVVGFFLSRFFHVETGLIAILGAFVMAMVCRIEVHKALALVEWSTLLFFVGLFMLIGALEYNHLFDHLGAWVFRVTQGRLLVCAMVILWGGAFVSAIMDNIPLTIAMIPLIKSMIPSFATAMGLTDAAAIRHDVAEPLYWSLALGVCLGGNGTLIGASANVVVGQIARRNGYPVTFMRFTREGMPLMLLSLVVSTVYVYLRYFRFAR